MWVPPELKDWKPPFWFVWLLRFAAWLEQRRGRKELRGKCWHLEDNTLVVERLDPERTTLSATVVAPELQARFSWRLRVRLWVALRLIRLAAWIIGSGFEVGHCEEEEEEDG
jgi:uncharacterized protein YecE (DUF72 family)